MSAARQQGWVRQSHSRKAFLDDFPMPHFPTMTQPAPLRGCIADDFTGATDLANILVRGGMRAVQTIGVPSAASPVDADALVVALKSRTTASADAVKQSLSALAWMHAQGCRQFFFKYCSTFDSSERGNIGPVADALLEALGESFAVACPASPENGRTGFRGALFVGDCLLNQSRMQAHPPTSMTDPNHARIAGFDGTRGDGAGCSHPAL